MGAVSNEGRTVLFVSHNMGAVQSLCREAILIRDGAIADKGDVQTIVRHYLIGETVSEGTVWLADHQGTRLKNDTIEPIRLALVDENGNASPSIVQRNQKVYLEFEFDLIRLDNALTIGMSIFNQEGIHLFRSLHTDTHEPFHPALKIGRNILRMKIPMDVLNEGDYRIVLDGGLHKIQWFYNPIESDISVKFRISGGLSESPYWVHGRQGAIAPVIPWKSVSTH